MAAGDIGIFPSGLFRHRKQTPKASAYEAAFGTGCVKTPLKV
jgi:hypothetical protein